MATELVLVLVYPGVGAQICQWSEGRGSVPEQSPPPAWFRVKAANVGVRMRTAAWGLPGKGEVMHTSYRKINGAVVELVALNPVLSGWGVKLMKSSLGPC